MAPKRCRAITFDLEEKLQWYRVHRLDEVLADQESAFTETRASADLFVSIWAVFLI